jgi:short-subunit dehydrogenase
MGRILNFGATGSHVASPVNAIYCATKAFVLSFSEVVAGYRAMMSRVS